MIQSNMMYAYVIGMHTYVNTQYKKYASSNIKRMTRKLYWKDNIWKQNEKISYSCSKIELNGKNPYLAFSCLYPEGSEIRRPLEKLYFHIEFVGPSWPIEMWLPWVWTRVQVPRWIMHASPATFDAGLSNVTNTQIVDKNE